MPGVRADITVQFAPDLSGCMRGIALRFRDSVLVGECRF
jgi:hypothetical protein